MFESRTSRVLSGVLILGLMACRASAETQSTLQDRFDALEREMNQAEEAFMKAIDALTDKNGTITIEATSKLPIDTRANILRKMEDLADEHANIPECGPIMVKTFQWAVNIEPERAFPRFEKLVKAFPDEPSMADALDAASFAASIADDQDRWLAMIDKLERATRVDSTRAGALYISAQVLLSREKLSDAKAAFEKVVRLSRDEDLTQRAKGFIFEIDHLQVGKEAPDFTARTLDGTEVSLKSLRGKVVLLDFWASWCPPCVAEIPNLSEAVSKLKAENKPFEILTVSVDEDRGALEAVIRSKKAPGIHTWSEKGGENPAAMLYNVRGLPTWYLIDQKGIIRRRDPAGEELVSAVNEILNSGKPPVGEKPSAPTDAKDTGP